MLVQTVAWCKTQGQYTANVHHWVVSGVAGTVTDANGATFFEAGLAPLYKAAIPTNCSWYGLKFQILKPVMYVPQFSITLQGAGSLAGDCLPTQVAGVYTFKTALAGKSFRGRMYLPATSEADNDATAVPSAAYKTLARAVGDYYAGGQTVVLGGNAATFTPVVYSRSKNTTTEITSGDVRPNWGSQRRRSSIGHPDIAPF